MRRSMRKPSHGCARKQLVPRRFGSVCAAVAVLAATAGRTVTTVSASAIAIRCVGRDVPGPAMLGALAAVTGVVLVDSVIAAVQDRLAGRSTAGNVAAVTEAFETTLAAVGGEARASAT